MPKIKHYKSNKDEVDDMLTHLGNPPKDGDEKEEKPNKKEEEASNKNEEAEESEDKEQGSQSNNENEEPEGEKAEEESKDEVIERLRNQISKYHSGDAYHEPEGGKKSEDNENIEGRDTKEQKEEREAQVQQFITDEEFEEIQSDPRKMNAILNKVYERAREDGRQATLRDIPEVVANTARRQMTLQQIITNFYNENPDLKKHAGYVSYTAKLVRNEMPEASAEEVLQEAEKRVRKDLALRKRAKKEEEERRDEENNNDNNNQPAFARGNSGRRSGGQSDVRTEFQKQADEMISSIYK